MRNIFQKLGRAKTVILFTFISVVLAVILDTLLAYVLNHELKKPDDLIRAAIITILLAPFVLSFIYDLFTDISLLEKDIGKLQTYDELTGLFNRPVFNKASEKSHNYSIRNKQPYCILAVKLDDFNHINEKYGISGGDRVLEVFGQVTQATVRDSDISTHMGGENFAIFLPNTDVDQAKILANRLREHILHKAVIHDGTKYIKYTTSIGISVNQHNKSVSFENGLKMAGDALNVALENGGNTIEVYSRQAKQQDAEQS